MESLQIDSSVQETMAALAHALAKAFSQGSGTQPGDPKWTVSGVSSKVWKLGHPDLPIVKDSKGSEKDVLLQLHVREPKKEGEDWLVVGQNKVVGPDSHATPKALILARESTPPGEDWNLDSIATNAANYFIQQKEDLIKQAQGATPEPPPPEVQAQQSQAAPPPPMASRRARLATRLATRLSAVSKS
jgi:hypothetical protein